MERLAQSDEQQGFKQEDYLKGFRVMNQQSYSTMRLHQAELTILIRGSKGGEIYQKDNLVQNLARKHNHRQEPSQSQFDGGYETTSVHSVWKHRSE
jgi:hypothetical protein